MCRRILRCSSPWRAGRLPPCPWARLAAKSTTVRPDAAWTTRAALVARMVWRLIRLIRIVSSSCASMMGAVTSSTGSLEKKTEPSGIARALPVNSSPLR